MAIVLISRVKRGYLCPGSAVLVDIGLEAPPSFRPEAGISFLKARQGLERTEDMEGHISVVAVAIAWRLTGAWKAMLEGCQDPVEHGRAAMADNSRLQFQSVQIDNWLHVVSARRVGSRAASGCTLESLV